MERNGRDVKGAAPLVAGRRDVLEEQARSAKVLDRASDRQEALDRLVREGWAVPDRAMGAGEHLGVDRETLTLLPEEWAEHIDCSDDVRMVVAANTQERSGPEIDD